MALFQPTNVIPSSFTVGVVDAEKETVQLSWQINGNSPMTAFSVVFYKNTDATESATAKQVATIAKTSEGIPTGGFYGTDRFGKPQMFTWRDPNNRTWKSLGLDNGNEYKFKITQYWEGGEVEQIEYSAFATRSAPKVEIKRSGADFTETTDFGKGSTLPASIGYFVGVYSQAQGAPVREVRWQVATWVNGREGDILADTGDVDTSTLCYSFNGFFIGNDYAVRCTGKADYKTYGTQDFNSDWINFTAAVPSGKQDEYTGKFTVQCLPRENAALLQWEPVEVIPPKFTPEGYTPTALNGSVTLPAKRDGQEYSITWEPNADTPWTVALNVSLGGQQSLQSDEGEDEYSIDALAFSPDSKLLVLSEEIGGLLNTTTKLKIYSVGTELGTWNSKEVPDIYLVNSTAFSPIDPETRSGIFVVAGNVRNTFSYGAIAYKVNYYGSGAEINDEVPLSQRVQSACESVSFSPVLSDGNSILLVDGRAAYAVKGNSVEEIDGFLYPADSVASASSFSRDGKFVALGGERYLVIYSVEYTAGTEKTPVGLALTEKYRIRKFRRREFAVAFSPTANLLACGSYGDGNDGDQSSMVAVAGLFSYDDEGQLTLVHTFDKAANPVAFSPDGKLLTLGHSGGVSVYRLEGNTPVLLEEVSAASSTRSMAFSPDGEFLAYGNDRVRPSEGWDVSVISFAPWGKLLEVKHGSGGLLGIEKDSLQVHIRANGEAKASTYTGLTPRSLSVVITPSAVYFYRYSETGGLVGETKPQEISYAQGAISSVAIFGGDTGATIDNVAVYKGDGSNVLEYYAAQEDFEPVWGNMAYELYMAAGFNSGNLDGGTGTASGDGFRIYRREVGSDILTPIATLNSTETSLKDYGIRSRSAYTYSLYAYDANGAFMSNVENDTVVSVCFKEYSLLVCDYDSARDEYHVRKQYLFALNMTEGSVSNNNSPTLNANFTAYPTRMPSTQNYASGTLQGLIGAIYTVPALVEQIDGKKHTAKYSTIDYFDSVDLEKELYDLSTAPYQLFLRDKKGHLRMIATNNAISMTPDPKKKQIPLSISFPWVEIGDASDVTVIQTPDDYGWNNDNQVLDVRLDVDPTTGILTAYYPKPYDGTKFYLTGVNKEILGAKTPLGVTPARFDLSKTAEEPDDGTLTATATVNKEEG